ncbi:glycosyltransferase [Pseudomonadota bacterium]
MISVVVATYNRLASLRRLVKSVQEQTLPPSAFELIVVDDGSTDGTVDLLREISEGSKFRFHFLSQENRGPASARNAGMRHATGEFVLFTDDDCIPDPDWLEKVSQFLEANADVHGCGGRIVKQRNTPISRYVDRCGAMHHPLSYDGTVDYLVTANAAYRREVLEAVRGFCEDISWPGGEDPDLSYRVIKHGGRLAYCHDCIVRHEHRDSLMGLYKMFFNHGRGCACNAHWDAQHNATPCDRFYYYVRIAVSTSRSKNLSMPEKITNFSCGLMRALGFARGVAYQRKQLATPTRVGV